MTEALIRSRDDWKFQLAANNDQETEINGVDNNLALLSARQIKNTSNNPAAVPPELGNYSKDPKVLSVSVDGGHDDPLNDAMLETSLNAERPAKEHAQGAKSKCKLLAAAVRKST
ncbi:uncharacterized protein FFB14_15285 [Fusarium fujikuroi]|nr:uncharacterized protein FFB14_15285 [Fusarium fujikuroi]